MSLINRMLQDLDARAGQPGAVPLPSDVRPVVAPERGLPWKRAALAAGVAVALVAAGVAGWRFLGARPAAAPVAAPMPAPKPVAAPAEPAPAVPAPVVAFEVPVPAREAAAEPVAAVAALPEPVAQPAAPEPIAKPARPAAAKPALAKPVAPKPVPAAKGGREETPAQRAENGYRRALASLEDGRLTEAIAGLQAALKVSPRHEAARQTLVGLLVEAKRPEEAMRQLQAALALDPAQPALAMLLARLQIERGGSGIETLMRSLPHAAGNGDYHAFLAGALSREGRQREAAEHYQVALRTAPRNGVWWMGLGIALQAEQRSLEAAGAFQKALDSGTLSAELQGFVERKLKQLNR